MAYVHGRVVEFGGILWRHSDAERLLTEEYLRSEGRREWLRVKYQGDVFSVLNKHDETGSKGYYIRVVAEATEFWFLLEARERREIFGTVRLPIGAHETQRHALRLVPEAEVAT